LHFARWETLVKKAIVFPHQSIYAPSSIFRSVGIFCDPDQQGERALNGETKEMRFHIFRATCRGVLAGKQRQPNPGNARCHIASREREGFLSQFSKWKTRVGVYPIGDRPRIKYGNRLI
jgi:hypothetical protein